MKVLDLAATRAALPFDQLVAALDKGFCGTFEAPLRHHHYMKNQDGADDVLLLMPAWHPQGYGGLKIVNVVPDNAKRGLPALSSSYILFDRETGAHLMLMDGGELTARRTAAASALAAKRLARPDSRVHLIVGAGRVGQNLPGAYGAVLPIETTLIYNRSPENAAKAVEALRAQGFNAQAVASIEEGAAQADVISCATLATDPVLKGDWVKPGQHIDLIGSFTPAMREADDTLVAKASVYVDTMDALVETGDLVKPMESGVLTREGIRASLRDLCSTDAYPRRDASEITLFKGVGTAIEDLSAGVLAWTSQA